MFQVIFEKADLYIFNTRINLFLYPRYHNHLAWPGSDRAGVKLIFTISATQVKF